MLKFAAQVKKVYNAVDGGFVVTLDVTENFGNEVKELLTSKDKNFAIVMEEVKE